MSSNKETSDFGKGTTYCLGQFLAHEGLIHEDIKTNKKYIEEHGIKLFRNVYSSWFYAAADHLYDLVIPNTFPKKLQNRLKRFQNKVLGWRLPRLTIRQEATAKEFGWALNEVRELLIEIDKLHGVKPIRGKWT